MMKKRYLYLFAVAALLFCFCLVFACDDDEEDDWENDDDDDDEDDDDTIDDDDTAGDDDAIDDDDTFDDDDPADDDDGDWDGEDYGCDWADELVWFITDCADLIDEDGNVMTLEEVLMDCNDCIGACSSGYYGDCNSAIACVCDNECVNCG